MYSRRDALIARCHATRAQTAELLERSRVLEWQLRETLRQAHQDRARRYGMLTRKAEPDASTD
jgi:hypothetical protein